jgi:hypothetical protein
MEKVHEVVDRVYGVLVHRFTSSHGLVVRLDWDKETAGRVSLRFKFRD